MSRQAKHGDNTGGQSQRGLGVTQSRKQSRMSSSQLSRKGDGHGDVWVGEAEHHLDTGALGGHERPRLDAHLHRNAPAAVQRRLQYTPQALGR
eukprot:jgi/Botrbrau1/12534/Bobra.0169s0076.1